MTDTLFEHTQQARRFDPSSLTFDIDQDNGIATAYVLDTLAPLGLVELGTFFRTAFAKGYTSAVVDFSATKDVPPFCTGLLNRLASVAASKHGSLRVRGVGTFATMMMRAEGLADAVHLEEVEVRPNV